MTDKEHIINKIREGLPLHFLSLVIKTIQYGIRTCINFPKENCTKNLFINYLLNQVAHAIKNYNDQIKLGLEHLLVGTLGGGWATAVTHFPTIINSNKTIQR